MSTIKSSYKSTLNIKQQPKAFNLLDDGRSERELAEFFNVGEGTISLINSNRVAIQLHVD